MAFIVQQFIIIGLTVMTIFLTISSALPVPRSDIIAGQDFLSLFIDQHDTFPDSQRSVSNSRSRTLPFNNMDDKEGILPIETMFSSNEALQKDSSNHHYEYRRRKQNNIEITTNQVPSASIDFTDLTTETSTEEIKTIHSDKSVDLITSGSKIVYLDSKLKGEEKVNRNDKEITTEKLSTQLTTTVAIETEVKKEDEVKVISVSVSSSIHQSQPYRVKVVEKIPPLVEDDIVDDIDNKFISNSHKNDFSIEEIDPLTQDKDDSIKSESTNIHSIVPPPSIQQSQPRSRTQRKQDTIIPYQTIIYHDTNHKEGNTQPRSVSYSSVGQTIGEIKTWREYDTKIKNKINLTESHLPKIYGEASKIYSEPSKIYSEPEKIYSEPSKIYSEPAKYYSEPSKVYSEPSKVYSEPSKVYGQPEKIYSEPSKIYSEPSKVYSEPSKIYSEPSKMYGEPSKVYFEIPTTTTPMPSTQTQIPRRIIFNLDRLPYDLLNAPTEENENKPVQNNVNSRYKPSLKNSLDQQNLSDKQNNLVTASSPSSFSSTEYQPSSTINPREEYTPTQEQNYEIDEAVSVMTNGRQHGVQPILPTPDPSDDSQKVGYVVEGRNYRKYRVEEKTPDGFIVGEYGVVSHNDGSLRGVRYTADSNINPKLIYDALLKFLSL